MAQLTIDYKEVHGVSMFCTEPYYSEEQKRIYGYKDSKRLGQALYPAFLPLAVYTVNDFEIVFGDKLNWTPAAKKRREQINHALDAVERNTLPEDFTSPLPPFDHQHEAIVEALNKERYGIFHDCGLGKTKTLIDVWRILKERNADDFSALLLCPSHLGVNWKREIRKHTFEGELSVCVLMDDENRALAPDIRKEILTGVRELNPDPSSKFYVTYPNLYYDPLPEGLPGDIYDHEKAYVEAIVNDDSDARTKARSRMAYRARKHGFDLPSARSARVLDPPRTPAKEYDVLVVSYDTAVADEDLIKKHYPYTVIAADESHYLRGYKSARSKTACRLAKRAPRRYLLSGTPSLGDPMHMYRQLMFLSSVLIDGWFKYTNRYLVKAKHNNKMVVGYKNLHVLNMILEDITHRKKQEDCLDLPPVRVIDVPVDVGSETRQIYNDLVSTWGTQISEDRDVEVQQAADRLNKLLQVLSGFYIDSNKDAELCMGCPHVMDCVANRIRPYTPDCKVEQENPPKSVIRLKQSPRLDACEELLNSIMQEETNKAIVWCTYTEELNMVAERLESMGLGYVRVDGKTRNKVACEDKFREDPECRVYLSHISISEGLTLNSANYTIYYGLTYDLKDYIQSKKRNDRAGQTRPVTIYRLVTPGSIHEFILRALEQKKDIADTMTDSIRCGTCEFAAKCEKNNVSPFEEECVYTPEQRRVITRPALL